MPPCLGFQTSVRLSNYGLASLRGHRQPAGSLSYKCLPRPHHTCSSQACPLYLLFWYKVVTMGCKSRGPHELRQAQTRESELNFLVYNEEREIKPSRMSTALEHNQLHSQTHGYTPANLALRRLHWEGFKAEPTLAM